MKYLSFIALFFYLGSLFPATHYSAAHNWADLQQSITVVALPQLSSAAKPVKHYALSADSDKIAIAWHQIECMAAEYLVCQPVVAKIRVATIQSFSARAPPQSLG